MESDESAGGSYSQSGSEEALRRRGRREPMQRTAGPGRPTHPPARVAHRTGSTQPSHIRRISMKRPVGASSSQPPSKRLSMQHAVADRPDESESGSEENVEPPVVGGARSDIPPQPARSAAPPTMSLYPHPDFVDKEAESNWESVKNRGIVAERRCSLKDDDRLPIASLFERVGWAELLRPPGYYYARLIRLFYCNLRRKDTRTGEIGVSSWVRGVRVRITPSTLAAALKLSCDGARWDYTNEWKFVAKTVSRSDVLATICPGVVGERQPKSRDLTPLARVLLNIINTNLLPKGGHRESVPPGYAYVLHCLIQGIPLSLPHLMISFMLYCTHEAKSTHTCPYPAFLTAVFEKINLD